MINEHLKQEIIDSFKKNEFNKVLDLTEKIDLKSRPSGLENIIGISRFQKKDPSIKDLQEAFLCFERAFLKEKNSTHGFNGLMNMIKSGTKVCHLFDGFSKVLQKASEYYLSLEKNYENNEEFLTSGIILFSYILDHENLQRIVKKIFNSNINSKYLIGMATFANNYNNQISQKDHYNFAKKNSKNFSKLKVEDLSSHNSSINKKINIGFVSCDFERNHSIIFFIKDVIKYLNRDRFKISIFSIAKKNSNDISQNELRGLSDEWFDLFDFSNQEIAQLIQKHSVDILMDLIGYTHPVRLELFNNRISPKQVSWLAYCNTTGLDTVDFLVADNNLVLDSEENLYTEKIIKLPYIWNAHSGFEKFREFNKLPCLNEKNFTLGSFNNFRKISDDTVETWSKILKNIPNSRLILKSSTACDNSLLLSKFKKFKVDEQIQILKKIDFLKKEDHLKLYNRIDLCLDTFPYNGVTTTFEALWMNVPVVVMKGYNFNSRCGESIIKNLNIDNLISKNKEEYVSNVLNLYKNKNHLIEIRQSIYENLMTSPLFDTKKFTMHFSEILFKIYSS